MTARNPAIAIMETARKDLLRLLVEFGMTPSSRTRVQALPNGPKDELGDFLEAV